jgi:dTDP-glucose pyrophosphorylase
MYPVALLAGGLATRLRPLTEKIPKSLVEVNGEPFLAHQLRLLRSHGIRRVVVCVGHLGEMVEEFAGDGSRFGLQVEYSHDGPTLQGTAGALRNALPLLGSPFFAAYGDSYLECDYRDVERRFEASGKLGLMTVFRNEGLWDSSNVEYDGSRIVAYDKRQRTERMRHIDWGLGIFRGAAFDLPENAAAGDLAVVYQNLLRQGELAAYEAGRRFYEIGSFSGIEELSHYLRNNMTFSQQFLQEARSVIDGLDTEVIERVAGFLAATRERGGRLFILGVGGSAANASHAVNDFRKIAGIEAYAPTDNVSELTARTNDEGWSTVFERWLQVSRLRAADTLLVFSVGGGDLEKNVSPNLVAALQYAKSVGAGILGIVGRDGGYTATVADACVIVPTVNAVHTTPHAEAFQAVVWHLLVSHPAVKRAETKWESVR